MYTIVSFYTAGTDYENIVKTLERQLIDLLIPHKIYSRENKGEWILNTQQKSEVLLTAMTELKSDIVWLDADAELLKYPKHFDYLSVYNGFDICLHFLNTYYNPKELLTGTIYLKNNPVVMELLKAWDNHNKTVKETDQTALQNVLLKLPHVRIEPLPKEYIKIKGFENLQGEINPVVYHTQASRQQRAKINVK
uniref:Putative nucleotide-diphospho-sugar transferase n=1 Tax=viral metagenome TaxID=1070528 RepID=A0A6M3M4J2_9ZZZZ